MEKKIISSITDYFEENIFKNHIQRSVNENAKLKNYKINPIVVRYLSKVLADEYTPDGIAQALFLPRVLGTSINTSFGDRVQRMFVELGLADGSLIKGMDIEFIDQLDGRKKWCQLKSGPNTINSEDVSPMLRKFSKVSNLARTNSYDLNNSDLILGVIYGDFDELSQHYLKINEHYPVYVGSDFWHRLTGIETLYDNLVKELDKTILELDVGGFINTGIDKLSTEVYKSELFEFS